MYNLMKKKKLSVQGYWQNEFCFSRQEGIVEGPVKSQQHEQIPQQSEEIEEDQKRKNR